MKEAKNNKCTIVDFSFESIDLAIKYCYEHDISKLVTVENASELLRFADKYQIKPLQVSHDSSI